MSTLQEFDPSENILNENVSYANKQAIFDSLGPLLPYIRTIRLVPNAQWDGMDIFYIQFVNNEVPVIDNWPAAWNDIKVFASSIDIKNTNIPPVPFGSFRLNQS